MVPDRLRLLLVQPAAFFLPGTDIADDPAMEQLVREYFGCRDLSGAQRGGTAGLALPLIAALVPGFVEHVEIVNAAHTPVPFDGDFDLVGITACTAQADQARIIAGRFRERGVHVAIGGAHATMLPDEVGTYADTVFVGEAEETWPIFLADLRRGRPANRYRASVRSTLRGLPRPAIELLAPQDRRQVFVQWSRGCPHACAYCTVPKTSGREHRTRPVAEMLAELRRLHETTGVGSFFFTDDNMLLEPDKVAPLLEGLSELGFSWATQTEATIARTPEFLERLAASGCSSMLLGLEDLTEGGLAQLSRHKGRLRDHYARDIERIQARGIDVCGAFIFGTDAHRERVFDDVHSFSLTTGMAHLQAAVMTPLPGTALRASLARAGRLLDRPWSNYNFLGVNYQPRHMSIEALRRGTVQAMIRHPGRSPDRTGASASGGPRAIPSAPGTPR